jgi:hypothetical protein
VVFTVPEGVQDGDVTDDTKDPVKLAQVVLKRRPFYVDTLGGLVKKKVKLKRSRYAP